MLLLLLLLSLVVFVVGVLVAFKATHSLSLPSPLSSRPRPPLISSPLLSYSDLPLPYLPSPFPSFPYLSVSSFNRTLHPLYPFPCPLYFLASPPSHSTYFVPSSPLPFLANPLFFPTLPLPSPTA